MKPDYPLELAYGSNDLLIHTDGGSGAIFDGSFWLPTWPPNHPLGEGFKPFGYMSTGPFGYMDIATVNTRATLFARSSAPNVLAFPIDFVWAGDDNDSGADTDFSWWVPVAPPGFVPLGIAFSPSKGGRPPLDSMVCLHQDYVHAARSGKLTYADKYSGGSHDLTTFQVRPTEGGINCGTTGHVNSSVTGDPPKFPDTNLLHCLKEAPVGPDLTLEQVKEVIQNYGPHLCIHPEDPFKPTSVDLFLGQTHVVPAVPGRRAYLELNPDVNQDAFRLGNISAAKSYVFVKKVSPDFVDFQFWFLYGYNGPTFINVKLKTKNILSDSAVTVFDSNFDDEPAGTHMGDWENVTLRVSVKDLKPAAVAYTSHGDPEWYLPKTGPDALNVYSAKHMHGNYPTPGDHPELAAWEDLEAAQLIVSSRNICAWGGEANVVKANEKYEIVECEFLGIKPPQWIVDLKDVDWGPKLEHPFQVDLPIVGHVDVPFLDQESGGPSTPSYLSY